MWKENKGKTHFVHRDGNKRNNTPFNVQWITKEENEADKIRHGTSNRGERNGTAKVTDVQATEIIERAKHLPRSSGGCRIKKGALPALAAEYGISANGAWQIINGYRRFA